jgi:hypothetical protein
VSDDSSENEGGDDHSGFEKGLRQSGRTDRGLALAMLAAILVAVIAALVLLNHATFQIFGA